MSRWVVFIVWAGALSAQGRVDYTRQIHAILADHCLVCHSQEKRSGGLSLGTYDDVLKGGRTGSAVKPGNSGASLLVQRITAAAGTRMPAGGPALSAAEIATIRAWIDEGARPAPTADAAKAQWEAPLELSRPAAPAVTWREWTDPLDRFTAKYLAGHGVREPEVVPDAVFARRAYLDIWGLLPTPAETQSFASDRSAGKRKALVARLLADDRKYSEHWISYWNDLLRNEEGVNYYSETAGRKSITEWLLHALETNLHYDQWVTKLLNPVAPADPDGFLVGVNWRGVVSASQAPAVQAAQNSAQIFLGISLKCNSCHDSFISKWKLKDAYALAAYFSNEETLQLYRCDVAQEQYTKAGFLFPELNRAPASAKLADRRAAAAAIFTDRRNGRMPRTLVNRIWERLLGRGIVENVDEMDGEPWSPELLDWVASDFVASGYDLKALIAEIVGSRTYQLAAVSRGEAAASYVFRGPELRRLTAEQFGDAVASITGDWHVRAGRNPQGAPAGSIPPGTYTREWRLAASNLARALGRPIRDQVYSTRDTQATTIQALELVNGEDLTHWLWRGARKMLGELPPEPASLFSRQVSATDKEKPGAFDLDVSKSDRLYLIVEDARSTAADKARPLWMGAQFESAAGVTRLGDVPVKFPSVMEYDLAGKGITRFRATPGFEAVPLIQGESVVGRFFVFDQKPSMDRLVPARPETPVAPLPSVKSVSEALDRVYWYALGRAPSADERRIAGDALRDAAGKPSADGLADLLWAVMITPEFQLIR